MNDTMSPFAARIMNQKYSHILADGSKETWDQIAMRVAIEVMGALGFRPDSVQVMEVYYAIRDRKFIPGGRYLYAAGRSLHQTQNCVLLRAEDSREGWATLMWKNGMSLMTGAGVGTVYSDIRPSKSIVSRTGGFASGPIPLMLAVNEFGRGIRQGGDRRSALWAGLHWSHNDCYEYIRLKDWSDEIKAAKEKDYNAVAPMDGTNISVILDTAFFQAYPDTSHPLHSRAQQNYWDTVERMLRTAEPGFSVDAFENEGENLRNACTEITSHDDSDICNIGSINLSRVEDLEEMKWLVELGTLFLLAGSVYSDLPYEAIGATRTKNRRLGLGLMGLHEWLLQRGKAYGPDDELALWLAEYAKSTEISHVYADAHGLSRPVKTRAIAPTGTIGILAETTTGVEPIFCVAFKRRYLVGNVVNYEYVVDPTAKRLIDSGMADPAHIEDAYSISKNPEQRIAFQAWLQQFVDHGISSTLNLPAWGSPENNESKVREFGEMLMKYLPKLRGITCYPDGARGGQPLTPCSYHEAVSKVGQVFVEAQDVCDWTKGGSCGS